MPTSIRPILRTLALLIMLATAAAASDLEFAFRARVAELREAFGVPGVMAACVLPDGQRIEAAAGLADSTSGSHLATTHAMPAGSVGKTGLAAVVLSLVADGTLDLDAPVSRWLGDEDWFARLPNVGPELTLRRLMNHVSGIPDHLETDAFVAHCRAMVGPGGDPNLVLTPREAVSFILDREPLFAVGEQFRYTDTAYLVAGLAAERASGQAYYDLLVERFLDPLDLDGIMPQDRRDLPDLANGYVSPDNPFGMPAAVVQSDGRFNHNPVLEWTGGGLVTRTGDLARWIWLLYGGRLSDDGRLGAGYLDDLLRGADLPADWKGPGRYGLAVFVQDSPRGEVRWHSGFYPGYNTMVRYWPDHDVAIAVQVNRDHASHVDEIASELAALVLDR
jgi:D-alanyl-D-alanine carboxypeptidase